MIRQTQIYIYIYITYIYYTRCSKGEIRLCSLCLSLFLLKFVSENRLCSLFKHAYVIVCMRVCVPVAHVKMKLTISKAYKLVLLHVAACCACITVSNCIIKQHKLRQGIASVAAVRLKSTILKTKTFYE